MIKKATIEFKIQNGHPLCKRQTDSRIVYNDTRRIMSVDDNISMQQYKQIWQLKLI